MNTLHLLSLDNQFIFSQLQLEEALLRVDNRNWCILNYGSPPAIVMGISGKPHLLFHSDQVIRHQVPVIRRFSGGGTVIVDANTLFATFIFNHSLFSFPAQPEAIMRWTESFYKNVFTHADFRLRENDYVFGEKKFGGNAQYLRKERWLHHTSFLWDYDDEKMNCLKIPEKTPAYRQQRTHHDFLCTLREHYSAKEELVNKIILALQMQFQVMPTPLSEVIEILETPHRKATTLIDAATLPPL